MRKDDLGKALNFESGVEVFRRLIQLYRSLRDVNLDSVPERSLSQIEGKAKESLQFLQQVQSFNPGGRSNPANERDTLIQHIFNHYNEVFFTVSPVLAFAIRKGTDFEALEQQARIALAEMQRVQLEQKGAAETFSNEVKETLEKVRRAAMEVGVAQHNTHFKTQADEHLGASQKWLAATIWLAATTFVVALAIAAYYALCKPELTTQQTIQLVVAKVVLFSVLSFATLWCSRIHRSHKHNYVVNKHRQNALSTFEAFVKATGDESTKNAVLLQTTQCIFGQTHSGFLTGEGSDTSGSPQILEVIRSVTGSKPDGS